MPTPASPKPPAHPLLVGDPSAPVALLAHGAGSTAEFVLRTFGPTLGALSWRVASWDAVPAAGGSADRSPADLGRFVADLGAGLVGGVSRGAHLAARWAAASPGRHDGVRLLLALPAWTGAPGPVGAAATTAADELERDGLPAVLARLRRTAHPWAAFEVERAWSTYDEQALVGALRTAAVAQGPSLDELATIDRPCGIIGLAGDPLHPLEVAERWSGTIAEARLEVVALRRDAAPDLAGAARRLLRR